jgi:hypothetical protein
VLYLTLAAAEGQPLGEGLRRVSAMLPRTVPYAWCFWIPCQSVNFALVPPRWRVLFVNVANILWSTANLHG